MKRALLVTCVLVVAAALAVWFNLAHLVRSAVESEGTRSMRLATTLDRATISLFGGKLGLHGFAIASPRGFSAQHMLEAGDIDVRVRYRDLRREPIHVSSLVIGEPRLVLEQSGGALNFRKAMEGLPPPGGKPPMKLVIDRLEVRDAKVVIRPGLPGVQEEIVVAVPSLQMRDVGRGTGARNGAAIREVALQVMSALAEKAAESDQVPAQVRVALKVEGAARKVLADPGKALQGLLPAGRAAPRR